MKKVGIITFHRSYNYGSALQAYALQEYINKKNLAVAEVIDYIMKYDFEQYRLFRTGLYRVYKKTFFADIYFLRKNIRRKKNFEGFVQKYITISKNQYYECDDMKELNREYDAFICGSDQIWNLKCTNGIEPAYFLGFVEESKRKVAYAPSIAQMNIEEKEVKDMKKYIESFDYLSVREEETVGIISNLTNKEVRVVLDPTLLLDAKDYDKLVEVPSEQKYLFVYILEHNDEIVRYAEMIAREFNIKVIYLTKKNLKINGSSKNIYGCSPNEFLGYIKEAEFVITNSFHATVFSILFEKKFCTFKTKHSYWRMVNLLEKLEISNRLYDDNISISSEIDYKVVKNKLESLIKISKEYLEKSLY